MGTTARVLTTNMLLNAMTEGMDQDFNRQLDHQVIQDLIDPAGYHVIEPMLMYHQSANPNHVPHHRVMLLLKFVNNDMPVETMFDISEKSYVRAFTVEEFHDLIDASKAGNLDRVQEIYAQARQR